MGNFVSEIKLLTQRYKKIHQIIISVTFRFFSEVVETNEKADERVDDGVHDDVARERRGLLTLQIRQHHSEDEIGEDQELEDHHQQQRQQQLKELEKNNRISWDGKVREMCVCVCV